MNKKEIGLALVARRDELRITQARLARVSGVSVHTLSNLETGEGNVVKAECVVTDEGAGVLEIKNIAVVPEDQGKGYGTALIEFLARKCAKSHSVLQVGTGESPLTVPFYEKCGFVRSHRVPNFFTDNYAHPIYEGGVQLVDMVYLQRPLSMDSHES